MAEGASAGLSCSPAVTARLAVPGAAQMRLVGARLARLLRRGDLVVLAGSLGAGKTTLIQGIGAGLGVRGQVTSPTFVIARVHPSLGQGPDLVHADAYRLGSRLEVDDLDLDADLDHSVTVVEWGEGLVEDLAQGHLRITIDRPAPEPDDDTDDQVRTITLAGYGRRWATAAAQLRSVLIEPLG
jgi:tRNA threonylcarbamoyladenosine biosynthesis protein TsaE